VERPDFRAGPVVFRHDSVVLEHVVRRLEAVVELVPFPHVVVGARRLGFPVLRVHLATNGPQRAGAALDPDHDAFRAPTVVEPVDDAFGKAPVPRGSLHASTIQSHH